MANTLFNDSINETHLVNGVAKVTKDADWIVLGATAIVTRIEINNDAGTDVKDDYIDTAANAAGMEAPLKAGVKNFFSAIQLSAGAAIMVVRNT